MEPVARVRAEEGREPMERRLFLASIAAALAGAHVGQAQPSGRPRVGWLTSSAIHERNVDAFRRGMSRTIPRSLLVQADVVIQ